MQATVFYNYFMNVGFDSFCWKISNSILDEFYSIAELSGSESVWIIPGTLED